MSLSGLRNALESADAELCRAIAIAEAMNLPLTEGEIDRARSAIDCVLFELEQKRIPEIANAANDS